MSSPLELSDLPRRSSLDAEHADVTSSAAPAPFGGPRARNMRRQLPPGTTVPIGWIAAGDPAQLFPPDRHEDLWAVQKPLDFPGTVYGLPRDATARERMSQQSAWFGAHQHNRVL